MLVEKVFQKSFLRGLENEGWVTNLSDATLYKNEYSRTEAIIPIELKHYIKTTQPISWESLSRKTGSEDAALTAVLSAIKKLRNGDPRNKGGMLNLLLNGVTVQGISLKVFGKKPLTNFDHDEKNLYVGNQFLALQELVYKQVNAGKDRIDIAFFVNGLPIGTAELKTQQSGQNFMDAIEQYRSDRNPHNQQLLDPSAGALFHFATDDSLAQVSSKLAGEDTRFIPFNTGKDNRKWFEDNQHVDYETGYLWTDVLKPENLVLIISNLAHNTFEDGVNGKFNSVRFPRYHQFYNLRKLEEAVLEEGGVKRNYLSQHAAGSGKSDEIVNLSYRLSQLHYPGTVKRLYDTIIVVTNRTVLDAQIGNLLRERSVDENQFKSIGWETYYNGVRRSGSSKSSELAEALTGHNRKRIVSVTAQTFSHTMIALANEAKDSGEPITGRYGIIVDEAHDGATGKQHHLMYMTLLGIPFESNMDEEGNPVDADEADDGLEAEEDSQLSKTEVAQALDDFKDSEKLLPSVNFFAYTATPSRDALRVFGEPILEPKPGQSGFQPFHTYSMAQARKEGFIMDISANYEVYRSFRQINSANEEDYENEVYFKESKIKINRWLQDQKKLKEVISDIILEKMGTQIMREIDGQGKAMLVCSSRKEALMYSELIRAKIDKLSERDRYGVLIAYSGSLEVNGSDETELSSKVNPGLTSNDIAKEFKKPDNRLLIVANKFQVGFNEPLLAGMFIDKKLKDSALIQTTGRVNRSNPGKNEVFIHDFQNSGEDVMKTMNRYDEDIVLLVRKDISMDTIDDLLGEIMEWNFISDADILGFERDFMSAVNHNEDAIPKMNKTLKAAALALEQATLADVDDYNSTRNRMLQFVKMWGLLFNVCDSRAYLVKEYYKYQLFFESFVKFNAPLTDDSLEERTIVDVDSLRMGKVAVISQGMARGGGGGLDPDVMGLVGDISAHDGIEELGPVAVLLNELSDYGMFDGEHDIKSGYPKILIEKMFEKADIQNNDKIDLLSDPEVQRKSPSLIVGFAFGLAAKLYREVRNSDNPDAKVITEMLRDILNYDDSDPRKRKFAKAFLRSVAVERFSGEGHVNGY